MLMVPKSEMESPPAAKAEQKANKNWLLGKIRKWHSWGGLALSVFILLVAITGFLLNHKDFLLHGERKEGPSGLLTSTTNFAKLPISFERAMAIAREHYGDVPLEKIELKDEHGWLMYKVARGEGQEIRIDARTGEASTKYGMSLAEKGETRLNWGKIVDDLHTGKFFGSPGTLLTDLTSGMLVALTLSGIYLWGMPILRKRQNARNRQANPPAKLAATPARKSLRELHRPAREKVEAGK